MHACLFVCYLFLPAIESNDTECTEEGEVYEYQEEEDQVLANQGKPSILDAYLILFTYFACFIKVYQIKSFLYCYNPCSNYLLAQAPRAKLLSSLEMTYLNTYSIPLQ
jgi:hypothetical protein